jgi:hypothetical protein
MEGGEKMIGHVVLFIAALVAAAAAALGFPSPTASDVGAETPSCVHVA